MEAQTMCRHTQRHLLLTSRIKITYLKLLNVELHTTLKKTEDLMSEIERWLSKDKPT